MYAALHNICIDENVPLLPYEMEISMKDNLEQNGVEDGRYVRDFIAQNYFGWFFIFVGNYVEIYLKMIMYIKNRYKQVVPIKEYIYYKHNNYSIIMKRSFPLNI